MSLRELLAEAGLVDAQFRPGVKAVIDREVEVFQRRPNYTSVNTIPPAERIPIDGEDWVMVNDLICCFVDMEGSTKLSAKTAPRDTARVFRLFTETAIRIYHEFDAAYIDVKGDGVFALFDSNQAHTALAATVSFKTFVKEHFTPQVKAKTGLEIGGHFGIDQRTILVRRLGLRRYEGREDRRNEVWAGKAVNMSAKLSSRSTNNTLWVSPAFFDNLRDKHATHSCGCGNGQPQPLWEAVDVRDDDRFDFDTAYVLKVNWCSKHGSAFCRALVAADNP